MATLKEVESASREYFGGDKLAANVFATKYSLSTPDGDILEMTPDDMHRRLAREFGRIEARYPNALSPEKIYSYLKNFKYIIPQGSPMSGIGNDYQLQSLSNCFVVDKPWDSYGGIIWSDQELVQICKRRGGVGIDISTLRPKGLSTLNAAKSTNGIETFMDRFSNSIREVAQNGRRGALMITISVHHPQILDFIRIKRNLDRVTGANISIRLSDEFMRAVQDGTDYELRFPVEGSNPIMSKRISAQKVWDEIIDSAWGYAEPGLLFWDNVTKFSPADAYSDLGFQTISTNPCVTGDTLIAVADGRNAVAIERLAEEGVDVPVYSVDLATGKVTIKMGRNPRKTGINQPIWRVTFDDGSIFRGTQDHRVMIKSSEGLTYVELSKLRPGDTVVPFNSFESDGYRQICNAGNELQKGGFGSCQQSRLIHEFQCKNFNYLNDSIENQQVMTREDYRDSHFEESSEDQNMHHSVTNELKAVDRRVVSVEFEQVYEDVYNLTVDDNHNYCVITSVKDDLFVESSGICVKNCGELPLCANDSCRLLVINLLSFVQNAFTNSASFDFEKFAEVVTVAQRLMDDLVDLELEKVDQILTKIEQDPEPDRIKMIERNLWQQIKWKAKQGRRTGLGVTGLADMLAALGIRYGSDESVKFVEEIYKRLALSAYWSSVTMAIERGAFPIHDHDREVGNPYLERLWDADPNLRLSMETHGRRNIALLTTAPAGSVSIVAYAGNGRYGVSSGFEPITYIDYTRRKKVIPGESAQVDFVDQNGDEWTEFHVYHSGVLRWADVTGHSLDEIDQSPYWGATIDDIDPIAKIRMQSAAQKWVCHAISNTTNLPSDISKEQVAKIYMAAWQMGCKGVTVYREGCRTGVIIRDTSEKIHRPHSAVPRPKELPCDIHHVSIKGEKWTILVGLMDGIPYEVMGGLSKMVEIPKKYKTGILIKRRRKTMPSIYDLKVGENGDEFLIRDIVSAFDNPDYSTHTRLLSLSLRHGASVNYVVEQLQKGDKDADLFSFSKVLVRTLKRYIRDGTRPGGTVDCPTCGAEDSLRYVEGCITCLSCGTGKCS